MPWIFLRRSHCSVAIDLLSFLVPLVMCYDKSCRIFLYWFGRRMALRKFIRHTPALFRLSSKNALVELTVDSIPTIDEIQVIVFLCMHASVRASVFAASAICM